MVVGAGASQLPTTKHQPSLPLLTVVPTGHSSTSVVTSQSPSIPIGKDSNNNVNKGINDTATVVGVVEDDVSTTTQPSGSSTLVSLLPQPVARDEIRPAEETFATNSNNTSSPVLATSPKEVQIPKMTFTLIETSGVLSNQALEDVTLSIETFLSAQLDAYYNGNDKKNFSGIHLSVVDDALVARATAPTTTTTTTQNDSDGGNGNNNLRRKLLRQDSDGGGVVIGTELNINGVADFINEVPPSPAEIVSEIVHFGKRYNEYLISNITSSGNSELEDVYSVEVGYYSSLGKDGDDESMIENRLPVQEEDGKYSDGDGSGSNNDKNIISGMKKEEMGTERSNQLIVIATVAGVAILTFLMFAFTSRRERSSRSSLTSHHNGSSRGNTRELVTVPIKICAEGGSISGSNSEEDDEVGSDPYIKCHKKGDSHISDLTTLASQTFASIVRSQSEFDKDLEADDVHPIVLNHNEVKTEYESEMTMGDEEKGSIVNNKCDTHEEEEGHNFVNRVNSCYTQDYSSYYNNSRSRSYDELAQSNKEMIVDRSYLPSGWHASHEGGFWNSLTHYHRKSLESSIEESASVSTTGSIERVCSNSSNADVGPGSSQLSPHSSTPTVPSFQREERDNEAGFIGDGETLQSLKQTPSEESKHTSDTASSPRNETLSNEWLMAMHGDNTSIASPQSDSLQSLEQTRSEASEDSSSNNSSSSVNDALPKECLAKMHEDSASVAYSHPDSLQSLKVTKLEASEDSSSSNSSMNDTLPKECLNVMQEEDRASLNISQSSPHQSLEQTSSEISEHSSSSPRNEKLSKEWLTAMHQGSASVVTSQDAKMFLAEKSCNERSGGFLSSLDCDLEEEDSEPSVQIQKQRSGTMNEDAFSTTSSNEEKEDNQPQTQPPVPEEREIQMRDSADLFSLVDSIVGESMGPGPSLADLVWLEEKIREKDAGSANTTNKKTHLDDQE